MSKETSGSVGGAWGKVVFYIILTVIVLALVQWFFSSGIYRLAEATKIESIIGLSDYGVYVYALVFLAFGWLIVNAVAQAFYATMRRKYDESAAAAIRSLVRILGLGGLLASLAGAIAGGTAGVALGGFIGLVVGFAVQQVLGQAIAGMFLLLARPFKIKDVVDIAGESEVEVQDITTMFTVVKRKDGLEVLIPSQMVVGQKIVIRKRA